MRSLLALATVLTLVLAGVALSAACGGGGGGGDLVASDPDSIPTATPPAVLPEVIILGESDVPVSGSSYTVQSGDTLSAIAEQFGTTVDAIVSANELSDPTSLDVGQVLIIPGVQDDDGAVLGATEEPTDTPAPDVTEGPEPTDTPVPDGEVMGECEGHAVQEGEYPEVIAPLYDLTTEELLAANPGLDPTTLQIGDCLNLP